MYREAPFTDLCHDPLQRLGWWKAQAKDSNGSILSVSFLFLTVPTLTNNNVLDSWC